MKQKIAEMIQLKNEANWFFKKWKTVLCGSPEQEIASEKNRIVSEFFDAYPLSDGIINVAGIPVKYSYKQNGQDFFGRAWFEETYEFI